VHASRVLDADQAVPERIVDGALEDVSVLGAGLRVAAPLELASVGGAQIEAGGALLGTEVVVRDDGVSVRTPFKTLERGAELDVVRA
jgi:hypothetical protein